MNELEYLANAISNKLECNYEKSPIKHTRMSQKKLDSLITLTINKAMNKKVYTNKQLKKMIVKLMLNWHEGTSLFER